MLKIHFMNQGEGDGSGKEEDRTLGNSHLVSLSLLVIDVCLLLAG